MKKIAKKGQMTGLWIAILTVVIAGFAIVLGVQLLEGFLGASDNFSYTIVDESGYVNSTGYTLTKATAAGFHGPAILNITNVTNLLPSANYTLTGNVVYNATATVYPVVKIAYTYSAGEQAYVSGNASIKDTASFTSYWELIALAVILGIIIPLIIWAVGGRKVK